MSDIDHERIASLLSIIERCAGHEGKLSSIANSAMGELLALNGDLREKNLEEEKARRTEENERAAAQAAIDQQAREKAEADAEKAQAADRSVQNHPSDSATTTLADRRI